MISKRCNRSKQIVNRLDGDGGGDMLLLEMVKKLNGDVPLDALVIVMMSFSISIDRRGKILPETTLSEEH